jgi:Holliday junction resolvase RusA-like endonuclease
MSRSYSFIVKGEAQPAGSKKAFVPLHPKTKQPYRRPNGGIVVSVVDDNPNSKKWKKLVAQIAEHECVAQLLEGPLKVTLTFYRVRPQSHIGATGLSKHGRETPYPITKPDAGKLARGTIDAMTGVIYRDDAQIVEEISIKRYGSPPRVEILIEEVEAPESQDQPALFEAPAPWETAANAARRQPPRPDNQARENDAATRPETSGAGTDHNGRNQSQKQESPPPWEQQSQAEDPVGKEPTSSTGNSMNQPKTDSKKKAKNP